jgi:hypothetical protein
MAGMTRQRKQLIGTSSVELLPNLQETPNEYSKNTSMDGFPQTHTRAPEIQDGNYYALAAKKSMKPTNTY